MNTTFGVLLLSIVWLPSAQVPAEDARSIAEQASRLNLRDYFPMDDPREAAAMFRAEATRLGKDLTRQSTYDAGPHIHLVIGDIDPDPDDRSFSDELGRHVDQDQSVPPVVCLVQLRLGWTVNDVLSIMERGIRVFRWVPSRTLIVRGSEKQIGALTKEGFVRWAGRYRADHKYIVGSFRNDAPVILSPLDGDQPVFREDLKALGASSIQYVGHSNDYVIDVDVTNVPQIAALWWVEVVYQPGPGRSD